MLLKECQLFFNYKIGGMQELIRQTTNFSIGNTYFNICFLYASLFNLFLLCFMETEVPEENRIAPITVIIDRKTITI